LSATVLAGGTIVTMNASRDVFRGDVLIEDGVIARVERNVPGSGPAGGNSPGSDPAGSVGCLRGVQESRTFDVGGMYVLPGFVQTHVHLCQTLFRGLAEGVVLEEWLDRIWALEAAHDPESMRVSAWLGCRELLKSGTTCVLDMGSVHHTGEIFKVLRASGIRAFAGKAMMDAGDGVPRGLRETTQQSIDESLRLQSEWHGAEGGRIRYAFAPRFLESCSEGLLRSVAEKAREMGLLVHSHASETAGELEDCKSRHGLSPVEHLKFLGLTGTNLVLAHCVHLEDQDFGILAETGTKVAHCPSCNLKLSSGIADIGRLVRSGARVSLGSDGAACNNNLDMFHEMRTAALLQSYLNGSEYPWAGLFLEAATLGGAEALGISDYVGSIEPGKRADLIVIDVSEDHAFSGNACDPATRIVFSATSSDVRHVFVEGRQIVADGRLQPSEDAERHGHGLPGRREVGPAAQAQAALEKLLARCK
jgi:cytosine/adenosine deaminase-related metal-dependent hydrolase